MHAYTDEELQDLHFLVHDKEHIMRRGHRSAGLERALEMASTAAPVLYRGLSLGSEMAWLDNSRGELLLDGYTSFSASSACAKRFAASSRCVLRLEGARGFDYSSWLRDTCRAETRPEIRSGCDLDYMEQTCDEEQEWILQFPARLRIVEDRRDAAGLRVVAVVPN